MIRESSGGVNTAIALGAAIILKLNRTMLIENGGHVNLTKAWTKGLLGWMGYMYVKRRGTTSKSKNLVENFEELEA